MGSRTASGRNDDTGGESTDELVERAGQWWSSGAPERAREALLRAVDRDDGSGLFDARASYAAFLLGQGANEEAEPLIADLWQQRSDREQTYVTVAAALSEAGRTGEALRWLNVGIRRLLPDLSLVSAERPRGAVGFQLLRDRHALRAAQGKPVDVMDELYASWQAQYDR